MVNYHRLSRPDTLRSADVMKCEKTAREHQMTDVSHFNTTVKKHLSALEDGKFSLYHRTTFTKVSNGVYTGDIITALK